MVAYTRQHIQRAALDLHLTDSECLRNVLGQSLDLRIPHGFGLRTQLPNSHMGIGSCCSHLQLHHDVDIALRVLPTLLLSVGLLCARRVLAGSGERGDGVRTDRIEHLYRSGRKPVSYTHL